MELPVDATFIDLMGNARAARATGRVAAVPLTSAPLFIRSEDGEGLLAALRNATGGTAPQREKVRPPFEYVVEPVGAKIDWERIAVFPLTNGAKGRVTASECIGCHACEERCPFGVPIARRMEQAAALFGR